MDILAHFDDRETIELEGINLILTGTTGFWVLTDERYRDAQVRECPPAVALYKLGGQATNRRFTPGDARDRLRELFEKEGILTEKLGTMLSRIPDSSDDFSNNVETMATLHYWTERWWPAIVPLLGEVSEEA